MTARVLLTRYVEPEEGLRLGMPRGAYHARLAAEVEMPFTKRSAHPVGGKFYFIEVCCPDCGVHLMLSKENHTIAADGTLSPSLVCPNHRDGCSWHVWGRLADWPPVE